MNESIQINKRTKLKSLAFTLAEVLIVLGIIGIIAELTIPTVLSNTKKQETVARVKKAYSTISQATLMLNSDCYGSLLNCVTSATSGTDNDNASRTQVATMFRDKLRIAKDCIDGSTGCFADTTYLYLNNTAGPNLATQAYRLNSQMVLSDGTAIGFDWDSIAPTAPNPAFTIVVDINNEKKPNQIGKDVFFFQFDPIKKVIRPASTVNCDPAGVGSAGFGTGCSSVVLQTGEITYY